MRSVHFGRESGVEAEAEADASYLSFHPSLVSFLPSHLSLGGLLERPLFLDDLEDLLLSRERERLLRRRGGDLDLIRRGGEAGYERERFVAGSIDGWMGDSRGHERVRLSWGRRRPTAVEGRKRASERDDGGRFILC